MVLMEKSMAFTSFANKLYLDLREKRGKDKMERKKKFERKASFCGRSELDTVELTWVILHWAE